jgi:hypothetical protein
MCGLWTRPDLSENRGQVLWDREETERLRDLDKNVPRQLTYCGIRIYGQCQHGEIFSKISLIQIF